jgi:hypothetical protein
LGFYDDEDPDWAEYGTLRTLLDQAKAMPSDVKKPAAKKKKKPAPKKKKKQPAAKAKPARKKKRK